MPTLTPEPGISVVIPIHGRLAEVEKLLESLALARSRARCRSEVIVVDSSPPQVASGIAALCARWDARHVMGDPNVRRKRNQGIALSTFDILLFVDSDCVADPVLLERHLMHYSDPAIGGVVGVTEFEERPTFMWKVIKETTFIDAFSFARRMDRADWGTCSNISFRRSALDAVGHFDTESFPFLLGGDDLDLSLRVSRSGRPLKCDAEARVGHTIDTWNSLRLVASRAWRWGRVEYHLSRKHPDLLFPDLPRATLIVLALIPATILGLAASRNPVCLLLPLLYLLASHVARAGAFVKTSGGGPFRVLSKTVALGLESVYHAGTLLEALLHRDLERLRFRILFDPIQIRQEWPGRVRDAWIEALLVLASAWTLLAA